jgi:hypothetical protein
MKDGNENERYAIHLDTMDSQILLLSKGHFKEIKEKLGIDNIEVLKALWLENYGVSKVYDVNLGYIARHMVELLESLDLLKAKDVCTLLSESEGYTRGIWRGMNQTTKLTFNEAILTTSLNMISTLQVYKSESDEAILELEDYYDSFLEVYRVQEEDYGVHIGHCCKDHGCKYSERTCPVVLEIVVQEYPCEDCGEEN